MKKYLAFLLMLVVLCNFVGCCPDTNQDVISWALLPMVQVDGVIYCDTGFASTVIDRREGFDGEITSTVGGHERPTKDNESNFGAGFGYQFGAMEGTIEICFETGWWIYATEEVRDRLFYPERYTVIDNPPAMTITCDEECIIPRTCMINWKYTKEDDTDGEKLVEGLRPLEEQNTSPVLTINANSSLQAWLHWEVSPDMVIMPDRVIVRYWSEDAWGQQTDPIEEFRLMESNEAGDSYLLYLKDGNYIYEVIATWHNAPNFSGTVQYSFHTAK